MTKKLAGFTSIALPILVWMGSIGTCPSASAQSALPDAPEQQPVSQQPAGQQPGGQQSTPDHSDEQPKRIFYILPNFRAVTAGTKLPPQTVKDKFVTASEDSFDYSSFLLASLVAAEAYATNATPEFHNGFAGYGRYFWHTLVDQTSENYFVEFFVPAITHEDTRYYSLGKGGFGKRLGYSLTRVVITQSDSGHHVFNAGEVIGAGISSGISNLYYPGPERTASNTVDRWVTNLGIDTVSFVVKEFVPDINHKLFHKKTDVMATP
jgi:hypothetical protein